MGTATRKSLFVANFSLQVKALLLFMWKHVNNNREKTSHIARSRIRVLISTAGSLNLFGSGLFSDQFILLWQSENFPNYTEIEHSETLDSGVVWLSLRLVWYVNVTIYLTLLFYLLCFPYLSNFCGRSPSLSPSRGHLKVGAAKEGQR